MRLTLTVAGRTFALDLTAARDDQAAQPEPDRQGATCGDLERAPAWDHDERPPVGFRS